GHLVRFLLADDRIEVVGDIPPGERASRLVQATQPDVVVVRPETGSEEGLGFIGDIRETCPRASVVVLTPNPDDLDPDAAERADLYLEETRGLAELPATLLALPRMPAAFEPAAASATPAAGADLATERKRRLPNSMSRWYTRLAAVAASAITVLSFALWRSSRESTGPETLVAPTPLTNPSTTSEETFADIALSQLDALESAMKRGADGPT